MKTTPPSRLGLLSIASLASLLLPAFPASRAADADKSAESPKDGISGIWIGTLRAGAEELPVEFTIEPTGGGQFKGVLRSPKQTPEPMPITLVSFRDRDLKLVVDIVKGVYEGKVAANGKSIRGKWTQGGFTLALDLDYTPGGFAPNRPQTPKPPFPYAAEEVAFDNPLGKNRLAGTLLDVTYRVLEVGTNRIVLTEKALARISIDRTQQRFSGMRAVRDAQNRAAKLVAEQIRSRLASYFLTRT